MTTGSRRSLHQAQGRRRSSVGAASCAGLVSPESGSVAEPPLTRGLSHEDSHRGGASRWPDECQDGSLLRMPRRLAFKDAITAASKDAITAASKDAITAASKDAITAASKERHNGRLQGAP